MPSDYFHINRRASWSPYEPLKAGDEFDVGRETNPYFRFFETERFVVPVTLQDGSSIESPAVKFLGAAARGEVPHPNLPRLAHDVATHFVTYLREVIWENVRRDEFPELPSRQRCLWLIPTLEGVKYWLERMKPNGYQVLRVQVTGRIHRANELYLLGDSEPMSQTIEKARLYWSGSFPEGGQEEILFEGRVKVIEVVGSIE